MIRLYLPELAPVEGEPFPVVGDRHHYLAHVLRARPGAALELFPGDGRVFAARVSRVERAATWLELGAERPGLPPSRLRVILLQARLRGGRTETVLQKATELGVAEIRLVDTRRCQGRWDPRDGRRLERLRAVTVEAAEQCGRAELPALTPPAPLREALAHSSGLRLALWEECREGTGLGEILDHAGPVDEVSVLCGPEGGFDAEEVKMAGEAGFVAVGLGPRVLRAETAPLAALAALQYARGDLRPGDARQL